MLGGCRTCTTEIRNWELAAQQQQGWSPGKEGGLERSTGRALEGFPGGEAQNIWDNGLSYSVLIVAHAVSAVSLHSCSTFSLFPFVPPHLPTETDFHSDDTDTQLEHLSPYVCHSRRNHSRPAQERDTTAKHINYRTATHTLYI